MKLAFVFGLFSILVSLITWGLDIFHIVDPCIYCRTQRTVIGLLGIILLIPTRNIVLLYITAVLSFFGGYVAADQMFQDFITLTQSSVFSRANLIELILASFALCIIIAQAMVIYFNVGWDSLSKRK